MARAVGTSSFHTITVTQDSQPLTADLPGAVSDGMGRTISSQYDSTGDELTNTYSSGGSSVSSSATYAGAPYGLPATVTGPDGQTEKFGYDGGGDLTSVTDPMGNKGTATYNSQGE